ncbi:hypothetical protein AQUCO_01000530v1 [Aquilegia coerulea]|uniref:Carbohydrate kinase PfkB domain-containing protein n=1 Tax=Aquilegia coerulea TaxID=218851 RepID=A0A2G5EAG9_AQUCA|nr:hypothetical protein AQUCO_01000530v1 [Aquilegia coerulea]
MVAAEELLPPSPPSLSSSSPLILGLQPSALVDHIVRVDWSLLAQIPGERGGSQPVAIEELEHILNELKTHILPSPDEPSPLRTIAGGSVANTLRGLATGFGISCGIIGACGDDEQGQLFVQNMNYSKVDLSRLRMKKGTTGQCVCLVEADGNRTMRPCLSSAVRLQHYELTREDVRGSKMVRNCRSQLLELLESGDIDLCFANEDEAAALVRDEEEVNPDVALEYLAKHCRWAVVTLGRDGCIVKHGKQIVRVPAIGETHATDATGAGDLFASGFLYGLVKGLPLEDCCRVGSCSGGAVIRALGGEVQPENWQWMYKQMQIKDLTTPDLCKTYS